MTSRRHFLRFLGISAVGALVAIPNAAEASHGWFDFLASRRRVVRARKKVNSAKVLSKSKSKRVAKTKAPRRPAYAGATTVAFASIEKPGTIIIKTSERALYRILGNGMARRYGVAVGKEGFQWSGIARVGMKRENPTWTPPPEMIERSPQYAKWADGMPGGLPINPLGPRAMYLYNKGDTGFRIHGTIHPNSIGTAASSGCIRMLNREVIELYDLTRIGTKVIVI